MIQAGATWDKGVGFARLQLPGGSVWRTPTIASGDFFEAASKNPKGQCWAHGDGSTVPFSAVVAVATITGSHEAIPHFIEGRDHPVDFTCSTFFGPDNPPIRKCSAWALAPTAGKPMHHWQLADVQPLTTPVAAKGRVGLWEPDPQLIEAVEAQLTEVSQ